MNILLNMLGLIQLDVRIPKKDPRNVNNIFKGALSLRLTRGDISYIAECAKAYYAIKL